MDIEMKNAPETTPSQALLEFFKALADANRLKIVGLLAEDSYSVEELAVLLNLKAPTVSHHLSKLAQVGLVSAQAKGYYSVYHLEKDALEAMAKNLLAKETLPAIAEDVDVDAYDRKVLNSFLGPDGRLKSIPAQEKKYLVILRHLAKEFKPGKRYPEKAVNEKLAKYYEDTASLRRAMISHGLMARAGGGGDYWRIEDSEKR